MKKLIYPVLSLLFLMNALTVLGQEKESNERKRLEFFKERSISKSYPASGNKLSIRNSFGHVKFLTWDKNEIKIDIHIESSSDKQDVANQMFDAIDVIDKQQGNEITFETKINDKKNGCKNCKTSMHIDYEVHLPASVALNVENNFGHTELPDYSGAVSLVSKFGKLKTGTLTNAKKIAVEFGSADIKSLSNIDASFKFSKVEIDNLAGSNKINLEFCEATKLSLDKTLSALSLHDSYSTVNIRPGNIDASYTIATSFGSFTDRTNAGVKRIGSPEKYGPDANKKFEGGNGPVKINIVSSFGNIILGEATAEEMKGKNKDKKSKDRVVHL